MKNKSNEEEYTPQSPHVNLFYRAMRITTFLLFFCSFCALAGTASSQTAKVTIKKANVTLLDVLNEIEHQTNYLFVYSNDVNVKRPVSIHVTNETVSKVLSRLFSGANVSYEMEGMHIVLTKKEDAATVDRVQQNQSGQITGVVVDEKGEPLIGVSVLVKGTSNGTVTNMDGEFTLNAKKGELLEISYIGYATVNVKADTRPLRILMKEDMQKLDEVVVVGYGVTTKRAMISSVSTVKAEEMANLPISNMTQGLAGRSSGLIVQASGGGVNQISKVSIRGGDTPLVVIDGVIREYNDFVNLDPDNIEAMSILKDASATAVYGSRASNGILQVTTKRGKSGKPSIEYNFTQSWAQPNIWPDKLNSHDFAYYKNEALKNDGKELVYQPEDLQKYADGSDPLGHPNTDWQKLVLRNFAPTQKHNITIAGGNDVHQYYASIGRIDQNSLYKSGNNYMKRTNFQLSETANIQSIGLKATAQLDGYMQKTNHPYTSTAEDYTGVFSHIVNKSPLEIGTNSIGLPYLSTDNPVAETSEDAGYKLDRTSVVNGLLNVEWTLPWVKGLTLRATGNYRFYQYDKKDWRKDAAQYEWDSTTPKYNGKPQLSQEMETGRSWTLQYFASYNRTFGQHTISALGGYECSYGTGHKMGLSRDTYQFAVDQIEAGPATTMKNEGSEWENGRAAWIAQVKYNYHNRYFVEGSMRYDGSDNFPKDNRWGTFYSGSLGWSLGDEPFMEFFRDKQIFDMLKLRVSYGQTGLDNWGEDKEDNPYYLKRFSYLPSYTLDGMGYVVGGNYAATFVEGPLPSSYVKWFTTNQFDFGIDFSSLNNRLYGMFDYFYYQTKGFLSAPDQLIVGYTNPLGMSLPKISSDGEHRRAGFELQLGWRDNINDFHYDVSFNVTKFDQLWARDPSESLDLKKNPYKRTTQELGYAGIYWHSNGFYTSAEDVYNNPKRLNSSNLTAGDLKYEDFNGDGVIDDADKIRLGKNSFPRANYGININLEYKGFSFSTLFQGASRFDLMLGDATRLSSPAGSTPFFDFQTDYWTPSNTNARYPRLVSTTGINGENNTLESDFWLINGAYFRMKDIRISYDFKKILLKKVNWLTRMNVGLSGQNIFTVSPTTKYGLDPENASTEGFGYPNERVFAININLGF